MENFRLNLPNWCERHGKFHPSCPPEEGQVRYYRDWDHAQVVDGRLKQQDGIGSVIVAIILAVVLGDDAKAFEPVLGLMIVGGIIYYLIGDNQERLHRR